MSKKENLRYTLDRLYECRNLEISNLWQRSVFLSVFLILCFSAYGFLALELVNKFLETVYDLNAQLIISLTCLFISIVGIIFSLIWILMAKGSKAWYEVYETAIHEFENAHFSDLKLPYDNIMGNMVLDPSKIKNNIFSSKAGAYSPSRINIAIGQISFILWLVFAFSHSIFNLYNSNKFDRYCNLTLFLIIVGLVLSTAIVKRNYLKSSFLG